MSPDTNPRADSGSSPPRSWLVRWRWTLVAFAAVGVGVVIGLWSATEGLRRRDVFFEAPLRLETGQELKDSFVPDLDIPYEIRLQIRDSRSLRELGPVIAGGWAGFEGAPGIRVSFAVRDGDRIVAQSSDSERVEGGQGWRDRYYVIKLALVLEDRPATHAIDVRIERAVPALASCDAQVVVAVPENWQYYGRPMMAAVSKFFVISVAGVALLVIVVIAILRRRPRVRFDPDSRDRQARAAH